MAHEVYLSYARTNVTLARAVHRFLRSAGQRVWFDETVQGGGSWLARASRAIHGARHHLILLTDTTPAAWQRAEFDFAARCAALNPDLQTLPLVRDGYEPGEFKAWIEHHDAQRLPGDKGLLDQCLRDLVGRLEDEDGVPRPPLPANVSNPYPGLNPYGVNDARYYFGRDRELAEALSRLGPQPDGGHRRWLRIEGPAGVGKASFARAGVVPAVVRGGIPDAPGDWRVAAFRPASHPATSLSAALGAAFSGLVGPTEIDAQLQSNSGLADLVREHLPADQGLLLVVDHTDDVVTESMTNPQEVARFDALLAEALEDFDQRLFLFTTGRGDLADTVHDRLPRLSASAEEHATNYELGGLTISGVRDVVHGPARLAGRPWPEALSARLVTDAMMHPRRPGSLSWTLRALWHGGGPDTKRYAELGGLARGVGQAVDAWFETLGSDEQSRARALLTGLVSAGRGHGDHPVAMTMKEAMAATGSGPRAAQLIDHLETGVGAADGPSTPLVRTTRDAGLEQLRLCHGTLPALWPTLGDWLEEDRSILERRRDAQQAAVVWSGDHDDLPRDTLLGHFGGADLTDAQRQRLLAAMPTETRRFVEAAEEAETEAKERGARDERRARESREHARRTERRLAASRLRLRGLLALLFLAATGATGVLWIQSSQRVAELRNHAESAQRKEQSALDQLRQAEQRHVRAEKQRQTAQSQKRVIARQRLVADRQGVRAEQTADEVLTVAIAAARLANEYFSRITGPEGEYAQRAFATALLQHLRERLRETPDNERLKLLLARQHTMMGNVARDRGATRRAIPAYRSAVKVYSELAGNEAPEPRFLQGLAESHVRLGRLLLDKRREEVARNPKQALQALSKARDLWLRLAELEPDVLTHRSAAASALASLGVVARTARDYPMASKHLQDAVATTRQLLMERPDDATLAHDLARRLLFAGDVLRETGENAGAKAFYEEGLARTEKLQGEDHERTRSRIRLRLKTLRATEN